MALFSDIDWVILLGAAAFLLFGERNGEMLRTLGRWYGRAARVKQELLGEFARAADIPPPTPGAPLSIRGTLLGVEPTGDALRGIPTAVPRGVRAAEPPALPPATPTWTGAYPVATWASTAPMVRGDEEVVR